ncbi:MAG: riboflavin synthase [Lachnospiraceae bacterium]|nr:riboflavin synthase [Lachnospiraceae bacterium]
MFTGIIEEMGKIAGIKRGAKSAILTIQAKKVFSDIHIGDSIALNGVCLTVTSLDGNTYTADVMNETLKRSSLGSLKIGSNVNLERAMPADGRFSGHIVAGHIDGVGTITEVKKDDNAIWYTVEASEQIMRYIVEKGSIAVDGVSLTVARRSDTDFAVSVIPHTVRETIFSQKKTGDIVNLENDIVGKYIEQLLRYEGPNKKKEEKQSKLTEEFLLKAGF